MRFVVTVGACALAACTGGEQGLDDWGYVGSNPSMSTTIQGEEVDAGVSIDATISVDALALADAELPDAAPAPVQEQVPDAAAWVEPDLAPPVVFLPPPVDARPPPDLAPPERCPVADYLAAGERHDSLLANGDFATNVAGWTAEYGATQAWDPRDAERETTSGALAVTNANVVVGKTAATLTGSRRCVPVAGGTAYNLYAQHFIALQDSGAAGMLVTFHATADCSGAVAGAQTVSTSTAASTWTLQCGTVTAPQAAHSMAVRLVVIKALEDPAATALFDGVLVTPQR